MQEWFLRLLYRVLGWAFLLTGALFFFFPDGTIAVLNRAGAPFHLPPAPGVTHRFWLSLGTAYMALVTALSFLIARNPRGERTLMLLLALGKGTSSLTCLYLFFIHRPYFVYFANFLVDLSLMGITLFTYRITNPHRLPPPPPSLSWKDREILRSIAEAFLPPLGPFPLSAEDLNLARAVEEFMEKAPPLMQRAFPLILRFIEWNPLLFHATLARFHKLSLEERIRILEAMERSRLTLRRQPVLLLKLLLSLHAYRDPQVQAAIGYSRHHLKERLRRAEERRRRGEKGPFPEPQPHPGRA